MESIESQEGPSGLGRAIAVRRTELGLKRKELAERASLSYPYVSELENGTKEPSARALRQLAEALELTATQLLQSGEKYDGIIDESSTDSTVGEQLGQTTSPSVGSAIEGQFASLVAAWRTPITAADATTPSDVADLVTRLVRHELDAFKREELPGLVAAELQKALAKALQQGGSR